VPTAIEQFDLQPPTEMMWAYGAGFHEPELDNVTARSWRWMSERAEVEVAQVAGDATLTLRGESPLTYFDKPSTLEVRCGESVLGRLELSGDFVIRMGVRESCLLAAGGRIVLTTNQTFSPADRDGTTDRRRLGLRLFGVDLERGVQNRAPGANSGQNLSDLR
jgi:hypothetical protein